MRATRLPIERVWEVIAFLKDSIAKDRLPNLNYENVTAGIPEIPADFERVRA